MAETDFFVAVHGEPSTVTGTFKDVRRFCSRSKQDLVQQLVSEATSSLLIMAVVDDVGKGKQICKDVYTQFAESIETPNGSYTQFALYFADDASGDLIQYRCERLTDIDAVVDEEGGEHLCSMTCATTVTPNNVSFDFVDTRLTLVVCTEKHYEADGLVHLANTAADAMACRVRNICLFFPGRELLAVEPQGLPAAVEALRVSCKDRPFGHDERPSSRSRLQDVRAWAQSANEMYRFSPTVPGPYFISLNPQLVVGEKLGHAIPEEVTYLVGEGTVASAWDFVALPAAAEKDVLHPSVYSPHCRIRREGERVWLKPECGMTYVNGNLLKEEVLLENNDRIIVGKQLAFRYVTVGTSAPLCSSSRILDWELCSKEFRQQTEKTLAKGEKNQLELDNKSLRERVASLEKELSNIQGDSWLILNNPPSTYTGTFMWPLDLSGRSGKDEEIVIGPQGPGVGLPFLSNTASLKREGSSLVFKCGSVTIPLSHGSRFTIGAHSFTVSLSPEVAPSVTRGTKLGAILPTGADDVGALRLSCFDLQWSIALLFDFAFPPDMTGPRGVKVEDPYREYRRGICRDAIMTSAGDFAVSQLTELNQQLTKTVRMIGAGMSKELNAVYIGAVDKDGMAKAQSRSEGNVGGAPKDFLDKVRHSKELSADLLKHYHTEAGLLLMELNASSPARSESVGSTARKGSPKALKTNGKHGSESRSSSVMGDVHVPPLGNLSMLSNGSGSGGPTTGALEGLFEVRLATLKGFAFVASPQVIRRAGNAMDVLSVSPTPKTLWEKYLKVLSVLPVPEGSLVLRQNYFLAILDVLLSTEYCISRGLLSKRDIKQLESKMDEWQEYLMNFSTAFDEPGQKRRSAWRHEAAFQKGTTPRLRPAAVKAPRAGKGSTAGVSTTGLSPPKGARRNRSMTPSGHRSSSKEPALGKPRHRAASAGVSTGRTPANLSTFGGGAPKSPKAASGSGASRERGRAGTLTANHSTNSGARFRATNTGGALSPRSLMSTPRAGIMSPSNNTPRSHSTAASRRGRQQDGGVKPKKKGESTKSTPPTPTSTRK